MVRDELPRDAKCVGEEFGIAKLVGLYYAFDDVDEADAVRAIDGAVREECRQIASSG